MDSFLALWNNQFRIYLDAQLQASAAFSEWLACCAENVEPLARMPPLADAGHAERLVARFCSAWFDHGKVGVERGRLYLQAWSCAADRLFAEMEAGTDSSNTSVLQKRWCSIFEEELFKTQSSTAFLGNQSELFHRGVVVTEIWQEVVQGIMQALGLPSRAEIDDLHKKITHLGRDLRRMRHLDEVRAPQASSPPSLVVTPNLSTPDGVLGLGASSAVGASPTDVPLSNSSPTPHLEKRSVHVRARRTSPRAGERI